VKYTISEFEQQPDADISQGSDRKLRAPGGSSAGDETLRSYMQLMGKCPIFTPEQELAASVELRAARSDRWTALLSYAPLVPAIRKLLDARLELDDEIAQLLVTLERSAEAFLLHRTSAKESQLGELCKRAGVLLLDLDLDSELAELLIADVERIANNQRDGLTLEVSRIPGDSRPFRVYLCSCRREQRRVRRLTDEFAKANLRLVVSLARRLGRGRLPLPDLVQEGNLGLLKAIERFDPRRGFRFSTYASWWIRHSVTRAIVNKSRQVRLPGHVQEVQRRLSHARRLFLTQNGSEPSVEELAHQTGIPVAKVEKVVRVDRGLILSLDGPSSHDDHPATDWLEDERSAAPDGELEAQQIGLGLEDALASLRPMEADILRRRYGLDGGRPETLREIGEHYALSRERIRQLQERAVGHMRAELSRMQLL
jgi:RNA polymerase primary sigma factor